VQCIPVHPLHLEDRASLERKYQLLTASVCGAHA